MSKDHDTKTGQPRHIYVSGDAVEKLSRIQSIKLWTRVTAVDALCDHFIATDPQMRGDQPALGQRIDTTA